MFLEAEANHCDLRRVMAGHLPETADGEKKVFIGISGEFLGGGTRSDLYKNPNYGDGYLIIQQTKVKY